MADTPSPKSWMDIDPEDALNLDLTVNLSIQAPVNELGERCPWPWEPQLLVGAPIGQYHCKFCGAMVIAGILHLDYGDQQGSGEPRDKQILDPVTGDVHAPGLVIKRDGSIEYRG